MRPRRNAHRPRAGPPRLRSLRALFATACLLLLIGSRDADAQFTRFRNYGEEAGLGNLFVDAVLQDDLGYLLLGTQGGLFRFDGQAFAPRDLDEGLPQGQWIEQIERDDRHRTWFVTPDAIYVRFPSHRRAVRLGAPGFHALSGGHFLVPVRDGVAILVSGRLQRAVVAGDRVGPFVDVAGVPGSASPNVPSEDVHFVSPDGDGGLLFGCRSALCGLSPDGRVSVIGTDAGLPAEKWLAVRRGRDGTLWARSRTGLAWRAPGAATFRRIEVPGHHQTYPAGHPGVFDLIEDPGGGILTQGDDGVLRWDGTGWTLIRDHVGGLPPGFPQTMGFDRDDALWLGYAGSGLYRSEGLGRWEHWTASDGLPSDFVWSVARLPQGQMWVAGDSSAPLGGHGPSIPGASFGLAVTRAGRLWTIPYGATPTRFDPATGTVEAGRPVGYVRSVNVDRRNRLWLMRSDAVLTAPDADAPIAQIDPVPAVAAPGVIDVETDASGSTWIASAAGVFDWTPARGAARVIPPAMLTGSPLSATWAGSRLWLATMGDGVLRFARGPGGFAKLPPLLPPLIASRDLVDVYRDTLGRLWIGSDRGIDVFDRGSWRRFDSLDGPISNALSQNGIYEDRDHSMWFGTSRGLSHLLDARHLPPLRPLHGPVVTDISLGSRHVAPARSVTIPWIAGPLSIRFDDLDFAAGRSLAFRYRIVGADAARSETTARLVQVDAPSPGVLGIELSAFDPVHLLSSSPVTMEIRILAPWWRTPTARGGLAAAIACALTWAWRLRSRHLLRLQAEGARYRDSLGEQQRLEEMVVRRTREIENARREMQWLAMSDALTGLPNRRAVMIALETAIERQAQGAGPVAALLIDIDHFKAINDRFGHSAGDRALSAFAARLRDAVVPPDEAGRYGGEEFLVVLQGGRAEATRKAERIRAALARDPIVFDGVARAIKVSGGLSLGRAGDDVRSLTARADVALYLAKRAGRDRLELEQDEAAERQARRRSEDAASLRADLSEAVERGEFELHFQPVVDVVSDAHVSCEALLRWNSRTRGRVKPELFVPFAETNDLMAPIGAWVLRTACGEATAWPTSVGLSVNLSPSQFHRTDMAEVVGGVLAETGLPATRLELELTETAMISDLDAAARTLARLRALGVRVALDDFGTGYSSLSFLRVLPFDRIKIDRSFVRDLGSRPEAVGIIGGMVSLYRSIGAAITAEGVETAEQIELLRGSGCRELQGYAIGRPMPAEALHRWMRRRTQSRPAG